MKILRYVFVSLLAYQKVTEAFLGFVGKQFHHRLPSSSFARSSNADDNDDDSEPKSTLDVIQESMGFPTISADMIQTTRPGLSGFASDSELGFVALLSSENHKCTSVVVSPMDTEEIRSPEALCMVQLAGGMDLGTAILPPDLLSLWVADELELEESPAAIQPRLNLLQVNALLNDATPSNGPSRSVDFQKTITSSAARDAKLKEQVDKFMLAIQKLPDVAGASSDDVLTALNIHADDTGNLDRVAFTAVLDELRRMASKGSAGPSRIRFELVVSLDGNEHTIPAPAPTVQALGLALRHKSKVVVSEDCLEFSSLDISNRFPKFRPIDELEQDAKLMDGFIPNMFAKATGPSD